MTLANDLLQQARELAAQGNRRPKQANLRRAISTAYYALFHLLVQDAAKRLSPASPAALSHQIARAFMHSDMQQACTSVYGRPSAQLILLQPRPFSAELRVVARAFVSLQEERHDADYDLTQSYTRIELLNLLDQAQIAFQNGSQVRNSEEANVFCAALLFHGLWARA